MDVEAVRRDADLPGIGVFRRHRDIQRRFQIGVVIDDQRRVAAELHRHFLHRIGRVADHLLSDPNRAGQRHLANRFRRHYRRIGRARWPHHKVHRPRRQVPGSAAIDKRHRSARRLRRGPHDHRAARGKRGPDLPRDQGRREIPGGEGGDVPTGSWLTSKRPPATRLSTIRP